MSSATTAASFLLRRRCCCRLILYRCGGGCRRSFATETSEIEARFPLLMLSSPRKPEYRYFHNLMQDPRAWSKTSMIDMACQIHLPEVAEQHCIGSSYGFLISVETRPSPEIQAFNPFTGAHLSFPSTSTLPMMGGCLTCCPNEARKHWNPPPQEPFTLDNHYIDLFHGKAVLSPSLDTMVLLRCGQPAFARAGDLSWTHIHCLTDVLDDAVFHQGRLHTLDIQGRLTVFGDDPSSVDEAFVSSDSPLETEEKIVPSYLVESPEGNDLFLVFRKFDSRRKPYRTICFRVFKLDKSNGYKWDEVEGIGDLVMFVGANTAYSMNARYYRRLLKPNSIYFTDNVTLGLYLQPENVGDTGVFNFTHQELQFYKLRNGRLKFNWPPPIWYMV